MLRDGYGDISRLQKAVRVTRKTLITVILNLLPSREQLKFQALVGPGLMVTVHIVVKALG